MIFLTDNLEKIDIERSVLGRTLLTRRDPSVDPTQVKVLLVWHTKIDSALLDQFPNIHSVVRYGVGYDKIDLAECEARSIKVFNNPDYGVDEVSDTAVAMLIALSRGVFRYDALSRDMLNSDAILKTWQENVDKNTKRLSDSNLGIIGFGRIGVAVARKLSAVVRTVNFYDPFVNSGFDKTTRTNRFEILDDLLANSDLVSVHAPLTSETQGMIDASFIGKMRDGSVLVNTARGKLIRSLQDIHEGLVSGKLGGVGLDVLPEEPPSPDDKDNFFRNWLEQTEIYRGKVIVNPHTAFYSPSSIIEMRCNAAKMALNALKGLQICNRII